MSWLDLAFLLLALVSVLVGAWRGFVFELISLLGWLAGFFAAMHWGPVLGELIPWDGVGAEPRRVLGMAAAFIVAVFASSLLATLAQKFIKALGMRPADRLVGAGFGLLRVLLAGVLLAVGLHAMRWQHELWWKQALISAPLDAARLEMAAWWPNWKILQTPEQPPVTLPSAVEAGSLLMR